MNLKDARYSRFALVREMLETPAIVEKIDRARARSIAENAKKKGKLLLTGEGSSRIFPAKSMIRTARIWGIETEIFTEGSRQAAQYDLSECTVLCASNSGKTKEVVVLARKLAKEGNKDVFCVTASRDSVLEQSVHETYVLECGGENAVAATKSVVETALFYHSVVSHMAGRDAARDLAGLGAKIGEALTMAIPKEIVDYAKGAKTIYFAGYNDGAAEELTLKTNEITRKPSDFLEGTYAVHGIEEVMDKSDIVFVVDPIEDEIEKFASVLETGVECKVVAIASRPTRFPTLLVADAGILSPFVYLCAGWNLLVEIGIADGIDLDKPTRARKVGNEVTGKE
jgi:glucosamine--fructose-6-phosphate aminotransferase (isomerizing)